MTHCLSNCDLIASKIKSFWKCWLHYFSYSLWSDAAIRVGGGFFFQFPVGQRAVISQAAVKGRTGSHPFFKMVTSPSPRGASASSNQRCEWKPQAPILPQKTASWFSAINRICRRLQPALRGTTELACTRVEFERLNTGLLGNVPLTPKACLHKIPKPKINLVMTMW